MSYERGQISSILIRFLLDEILSDSGIVELSPEENLLEDGHIDSLGVMRLLAHIQETFGYEVPPEEVTVENFITVEAITNFLHPRLN